MNYKIEDLLALNKFNADEEHAHIKVDAARLDQPTLQALLKACPAGLYVLDAKHKLAFDHIGCLECGTCRVLCAHLPGALEWNYPRSTKGVFYRYG